MHNGSWSNLYIQRKTLNLFYGARVHACRIEDDMYVKGEVCASQAEFNKIAADHMNGRM